MRRWVGGLAHNRLNTLNRTLVLRHGAIRWEVGVLQEALNVVTGAGLQVDNDFGGKTSTAVENLQRFFGLKVDAVAGPKTFGLLRYLTAQMRDGKA